MEWWTEEDIKEAKANGISYQTFYARIYFYEWSIEKAKTTPVMSKSEIRRKYPAETLKKAIANGISQSVFYYRINHLDMSPEQAATTKKRKERKITPPDLVKKAKEHGVIRATLNRRIREGWSPESAATTPPLSKTESGAMGGGKRWSVKGMF